MAITVAVVGSVDPHLGGLIRHAGHQVKEVPLEKLAELSAGDSRPPEVVLVDLRSHAGLPPSVAALKRQHPDTGMIVLAARLDPTMMLDAMRMGASEFLSDPINADDVEAAITRVTANRAGAGVAQIFAFVGAKGGVGTTTIAVNVATTLATLSVGRTLLLDLHMMGGDAAIFLGVEPKFSVVDALENSHRLDESLLRSLVTRAKTGLDLLASSEHIVGGQFDTGRIRALIEFVARYYGFVVLDIPRLHPMILDALDPATAIVVVTSQEVASVRSGARLWATLSQRYGRDKARVVVGRANALTEISRQDIEKALGTGIRHQIPSDYARAVEAVNTGRPLALDNHNELTSSITALARELAGLAADKNQERRGGLFGRLTGRRS